MSGIESPQEAHEPLEGSGGYLLDLPPHDDLQKVGGRVVGFLVDDPARVHPAT